MLVAASNCKGGKNAWSAVEESEEVSLYVIEVQHFGSEQVKGLNSKVTMDGSRWAELKVSVVREEVKEVDPVWHSTVISNAFQTVVFRPPR